MRDYANVQDLRDSIINDTDNNGGRERAFRELGIFQLFRFFENENQVAIKSEINSSLDYIDTPKVNQHSNPQLLRNEAVVKSLEILTAKKRIYGDDYRLSDHPEDLLRTFLLTG